MRAGSSTRPCLGSSTCGGSTSNSGQARRTALITFHHSRLGLLSLGSRLAQANRLLSDTARHWPTRTVFPEPAGADRRMSRAVASDSWRSKAGRSSHSGRISGGWILLSSGTERLEADASRPVVAGKTMALAGVTATAACRTRFGRRCG
jgi:hypothetical protein